MAPIVLVSFLIVVGLAVFISISKNDLGVKTFKNTDIKDESKTNEDLPKDKEDLKENSSSEIINDDKLESNTDEEKI